MGACTLARARPNHSTFDSRVNMGLVLLVTLLMSFGILLWPGA